MAKTKRLVSTKDTNKLRNLYDKHYTSGGKKLTDGRLRDLAKAENINLAQFDKIDNYNQELQSYIINKLKEKQEKATEQKPEQICWDCGKSGHYAKTSDCELMKDEICFKCAKKGHWQKHCPILICPRCQFNHKIESCFSLKDTKGNSLRDNPCSYNCGITGCLPHFCPLNPVFGCV